MWGGMTQHTLLQRATGTNRNVRSQSHLPWRVREKLKGELLEACPPAQVGCCHWGETRIRQSLMPMAAGLEPLGPLSCHISGPGISPRGEYEASLQCSLQAPQECRSLWACHPAESQASGGCWRGPAGLRGIISLRLHRGGLAFGLCCNSPSGILDCT